MQQRKTAGLGFALALLALGVGLLMASSQAFAGGGEIRAGDATASIGTEVVVDVDSLNMTAPGLGAWSIDVTYDPSVVTVQDCAEQNGSVCNPAFDADSVRIAGASASGLEGNDTLASITFRCDVEGTSPVTLDLRTLADATPAEPAPLDATVTDASVDCVTEVAGEGAVIKVGSDSAALGDTASVELESLNVPEPGLGAWTIDVTYDPNVVHTISCTPGSSGLSVCNAGFSDNTLRVTGANIDGLSGDNVLAGLTFECDAVDESPLTLTVQVLVDATVGQPQTIDATTIDGSISCAIVSAPTPTRTPPGALPTSGSGGGSIGFDPGHPVSWLIAGLIGAGLAWLASGIAGAGLQTITAGSSSKPVARRPAAPQPRATRPYLPRSIPAWRARKVDLGSPPDAIEPDEFRPAGRP